MILLHGIIYASVETVSRLGALYCIGLVSFLLKWYQTMFICLCNLCDVVVYPSTYPSVYYSTLTLSPKLVILVVT